MLLCGESCLDFFPVDDIPEVLDVLRPSIPIVDIVRMFPDVAGQQWSRISRHWCLCVRCRYDIECPIGSLDEPCPSRSEGLYRFFAEFFLKILERCPPRLYRFEECTTWFSTCISRQWIKIKCMIPDLSGIIKNRSFRSFFHDILEWSMLEFRPRNQRIQCVDVRLMVFSWVKFECLSWDVGSKRIECVGKFWFCNHGKIFRK